MDWLLSHVRLLFFSIIPCSYVGVVLLNKYMLYTVTDAKAIHKLAKTNTLLYKQVLMTDPMVQSVLITRKIQRINLR